MLEWALQETTETFEIINVSVVLHPVWKNLNQKTRF